jgi:hypothetical protein
MARNVFYSFPIDTPAVESPTKRYRESEAPGNDSHLNPRPEDTVRRDKGDLGAVDIPGFEPQPLSSKGVPFKNLRGGK